MVLTGTLYPDSENIWLINKASYYVSISSSWYDHDLINLNKLGMTILLNSFYVVSLWQFSNCPQLSVGFIIAGFLDLKKELKVFASFLKSNGNENISFLKIICLTNS